MSRAWVALGSNLDHPRRQVEGALRALTGIPATRLVAASSLYHSEPWGMTEQPAFINAVAGLETDLEPLALLHQLQAIEQRNGRDRSGPRWGPRTLDLDLLTHGQAEIASEELVVPHPYMAQRAFVLLPLDELAPLLVVPGQGRVHDLLARVDTSGCQVLA